MWFANRPPLPLASPAAQVVAKMDGTANEVQGINIRGFPTIQVLLRTAAASVEPLQFYPAGPKTASSGKSYDVCGIFSVCLR